MGERAKAKRAEAKRELNRMRKERAYMRALLDLFEPLPESQFLRLLKKGHKPNGLVAMREVER